MFTYANHILITFELQRLLGFEPSCTREVLIPDQPHNFNVLF